MTQSLILLHLKCHYNLTYSFLDTVYTSDITKANKLPVNPKSSNINIKDCVSTGKKKNGKTDHGNASSELDPALVANVFWHYCIVTVLTLLMSNVSICCTFIQTYKEETIS